MFFRKSKKRNYKKELNEALSKLSDALWDNIMIRTDIEELKEENIFSHISYIYRFNNLSTNRPTRFSPKSNA